MRLTFIHDHKFHFEKGSYYSSGKFSNLTMERYLVEPIDNIQFIGRQDFKTNSSKNLVKASSEKIFVNPMTFLKNKTDFIFKRKKIYEFLEENIHSEDIVIIRLPSEVGYVAADYLKNKNIPYGIELVGDPWDSLWYHGSAQGKLMAFINKRKVKNYIYNSNNTIYVTKEYLQKKYPSKKNTYNASNVLIKEINNNYKSSDKLNKKIGLIGSLDTKYKGIDTALKSMKLLDSHICLEIVGNGPQEIWMQKINKYNLNNRVFLKGTLKGGNEMNEWFSTLDLYIQPSYTEGLPRALIEAMANGIPCLGSDVGGIPELLRPEYTHRAKDYKELTKQMNYVLSNESMREKMSKQNLNTAKDYLSTNIQKEREKFIKSICRERVKYES